MILRSLGGAGRRCCGRAARRGSRGSARGWALARRSRSGWGAILVQHVANLDRLARWARAALDAHGPGGHRAVAAAFVGAVPPRAHARARTSATSRTRSSASRAPPRRFPTAWSCSTRATASSGRTRARSACSGSTSRTTSARRSRTSCGSPSSSATSTPATTREPVVVDSQRDAGVTLAIQIVPFGVAEKLLIARDVTQIEAVARMRRDFIANVSHELKTPLTVISGFVETLQELDLDERQRDALPAADAASRRRACSGWSRTC